MAETGTNSGGDFNETVSGTDNYTLDESGNPANQTFSRTILTQFTVMLSTTALFLFGGDRLNALSFTLLVGFVSGAYSSVFVASPILVLHQRWWSERRRRA